MKFVLVVIVCLSLTIVPTVWATVHTVGNSNSSHNHSTIQECSNATQPGDSCVVYPGSYPENPTVTAGVSYSVYQPNTVKVWGFRIGNATSGKDGVTISGFEITEPTLNAAKATNGILCRNSNNLVVKNVWIHEVGTSQGFRLGSFGSPCNNSTIDTVMITWPAARQPLAKGGTCTINCGRGSAAILNNGNYNLIKNSNISHVTDYVTAYGDYLAIVDNTFGQVDCPDVSNGNCPDLPDTTDPMHVDGVQSQCYLQGQMLPLRHVLVEGNLMYNNNGKNSHFALFQDGTNTTDVCGSKHAIVRFNKETYVGSAFLYDDAGGFSHVKAYNNTIAWIQSQMTGGKYPVNCEIAAFENSSSYGAFKNNLMFNVTNNNCDWYYVDNSSLNGFSSGYNAGYLRNYPPSTTWAPGCTDRCSYSGQMGDTNNENILNVDPRFVNIYSDYRLNSLSPLLTAGGPLTQVAASDSGKGSTLIVEDADYFQAGLTGRLHPDYIAVGNVSNIVQIVGVNYEKQQITLAVPINRSGGDQVWLKVRADGTNVLPGLAPSVGAY